MNDITTHFIVPPQHPSLAGHFPGHPIVPGVVLLDLVLEAIRSHGAATSTGQPLRLASIVSTKFLQAVAPDTRVDLQVNFTPETEGQWKARFAAAHAGAPVLEGSFLLVSAQEAGAA
jgi:3-hydroxymyristoyl/3-hydroxydecanoyl-(acyl carrier protein) dehydratase